MLRKRASYSAHNAMAMNVVLDRAQGFGYAMPCYATHAQALLARHDTALALDVVLAGLTGDVTR